jgi:hypothetical protein
MAGGFFATVVAIERTSGDEPTFKLNRYETARSMIAAVVRRRVGGRQHEISKPWRALVDTEFDKSNAKGEPLSAKEALAREEKAAALERIVRGRFSVLIGPAGSGKTTLKPPLPPRVHHQLPRRARSTQSNRRPLAAA